MRDVLKEYTSFFGKPTKVVHYKNGQDHYINEVFENVLALNPGDELRENLEESDLVIMLKDEYKAFNGNLQRIKILTDNPLLYEDFENYQFIGSIGYEDNKAIFSQVRIIPEGDEFYILKKR